MKAPTCVFFVSLLLAGSLLSTGCQTQSVNTSTAEGPVKTTQAMPKGSATTAAPKNTLVGKTVAQIKQLGYYNCIGSALSDVPGGTRWYSVHWAPNNKSCFKGKSVFTLEKVLSGNGQFTEDRVVEAELVVDYGVEKSNFILATLSLAGGPKGAYVVQHTSKGYGTVSGVQRLWHMNLTTQKFEAAAVPANFSFPHPYQVEGE